MRARKTFVAALVGAFALAGATLAGTTPAAAVNAEDVPIKVNSSGMELASDASNRLAQYRAGEGDSISVFPHSGDPAGHYLYRYVNGADQCLQVPTSPVNNSQPTWVACNWGSVSSALRQLWTVPAQGVAGKITSRAYPAQSLNNPGNSQVSGSLIKTYATSSTAATLRFTIGTASSTPSPTPTPTPTPTQPPAGDGPKTNRLNLSFTSGGITSTYHLFAAGLDWTKPVGLLTYTDGSGGYGFDNPNSTYLLDADGADGLVAVAKKHNLVLLVPQAPAPDCDGYDNCWYNTSTTPNAAAKAAWSNALIGQVKSQYSTSTDRQVIGGYSSGAQWTTRYFLPRHGEAQSVDLAVAIAYGGAPDPTSAASFSAAYKASTVVSFDTGTNDEAYSTAAYGARGGEAWYRGAGFTTDATWPAGVGHDRSGQFDAVMDREITQHLDGAGSTPTPTATASSPPVIAPNAPVRVGSLAFSDEFDGTALDRQKWGPCWYQYSASGDACGSMNGSTTLKSNVAVTGGNLVLTQSSQSEGALVSTNPPQAGTSYNQPGAGFLWDETGYAEARVYFPGNGSKCYNWPAWWTNGPESGYGDGEHDVAEVLGDGVMTSNYHHEPSGAHVANNYTVPGYWCGGYHTYGVHRKATSSDVYFDGELVRSYATTDGLAPHELIFNTGWTSGKTYGAGAQVKVDYVRVWQTS